MLLVCCTHICYLPARIKHTCCICAAHKTYSFCMCAAYRIMETAPHVCNTHTDKVCTHLSKVCTMCAMVMCSMCAVAHVLEAHMLHMNNCTHSAMYSAHLMCLSVAYMWCVSIFVYAAHVKKMPNMCSKVTGIYTIKMGCTTYTHGCTTCQSKTTPKGVQKKVYTVFPRIVSAESILFRSSQLRLLNEGGY